MILNRTTYILVSDTEFIFPADDLYPSDDLYPTEASIETNQITTIVEGSMKLDEMLVDGELRFGTLCASKFEVKVYNTENLAGKFIIVVQQDNDIWNYIFSGKIDSCKLDSLQNDRTIIAYDLAYYKGELDVTNWYASFWASHTETTLKELRESLCKELDVKYTTHSLLNDDLIIHKSVVVEGLKAADILQNICELSCCFPHFTRNSVLDFLTLDSSTTPINMETKYEKTNSIFQEYTTQPISGIAFYNSDQSLKHLVGTMVNAYTMPENILLYDATNNELNSIASGMLQNLEGIVYTPGKLKLILGSFDYRLGDLIETTIGSFYIFQNSYSGIQLIEQTASASGDEYLSRTAPASPFNTIIEAEKRAQVSQTVGELEIQYEELQGEVSLQGTKITQNTASITLEAQRAEAAENAEVQRAQNAEAALGASIEVLPHTIAMQVGTSAGKSTGITVSLLDKEGNIVNSTQGTIVLSGDVIMTSNLTDGVTTISGANITTGDINCDRLNGGTIRGQSIVSEMTPDLSDEFPGEANDSTNYKIQIDYGNIWSTNSNSDLETRISQGSIQMSGTTTPQISSSVSVTSYCEIDHAGLTTNSYTGTETNPTNETLAYIGLGQIYASGTKSRLVTTENYNRRLLYCYETPCPTFGDIGEGITDDIGVSVIYIEDIFSQTIDTDVNYQVFLQVYGDGKVYVDTRTPSYFVVKGTPNIHFGWEIKAIQKEYDTMRLEELDPTYQRYLMKQDYGTDSTLYYMLNQADVTSNVEELLLDYIEQSYIK